MKIGDKIPAISLFDTAKRKIDLAERGNPIVLLFFPLAFTSTCTTELCAVRDDIARYDALKAEVYGISVDSLYALAKFKDEQQLNFELLSDFNKEATRAFDVVFNGFAFDIKEVSKRAAFVIDKEGIVRYAEICPTLGDLPDFDQIKSALQQLSN